MAPMRRGGPDDSRGQRGNPPRRGRSAGAGPVRRDTQQPEPELPDGAVAGLLDPPVRAAVLSLGGPLGASVARHLAAVGLLIDIDPERAVAHAQFAKDRAGRIPDVREALGVAAYAAGRFDLARAELRAARRMSERPDLLPLLADCERGLGHPERALQVAAGPEARLLGPAEQAELAIVSAGARRDLGEFDAALRALEVARKHTQASTREALRLQYAYADTLAMGGRSEEARALFRELAALDDAGETDAAQRAAELSG